VLFSFSRQAEALRQKAARPPVRTGDHGIFNFLLLPANYLSICAVHFFSFSDHLFFDLPGHRAGNFSQIILYLSFKYRLRGHYDFNLQLFGDFFFPESYPYRRIQSDRFHFGGVRYRHTAWRECNPQKGNGAFIPGEHKGVGLTLGGPLNVLSYSGFNGMCGQ
jgi:hypothetical protein